MKLLVVASLLPHPRSNDPVLRQLFRRVAALASVAGTSTELVIVEPHPIVADPAAFAEIGITLRPLSALDAATPDIVLSTATFSAPLEKRISALCEHSNARRTILLADSTSFRSARSERNFRVPDALGIETVSAALRQHERTVLSECDVIVVDNSILADHIQQIAPDSTVVTNTPPVPVAESLRSGDRVLYPGRWATTNGADEAGLREILNTDAATTTRLARHLDVLGEDIYPAVRRAISDHRHVRRVRALHDSEAAMALIWRRTGSPATSRWLELAGLGIAAIAHPFAVEGLPGSEQLSDLWIDDAAAAVDAVAGMRREPSQWQGLVREVCHESASPAQSNGQLIDIIFDQTHAAPTASEFGTRVFGARTAGAFDAQHQMATFEAELVPEPALDREDTARLQVQMTEDERYRLKVRTHDRADLVTRLTRRNDELAALPVFSIVMPTWNTGRATLLSAVESVRAQTYPHWQLCVADDASTDAATRAAVAQLSDLDSRISVVQLEENRGIAGATNAALELVTGNFVAFLDHDDEIRPDALFWNARLLDLRPELDIIYSDEDKLNQEGERWWPFHKPDFSRAMLSCVNYMTHFLVVRRTLLDEVGGLALGYDGAQDYELILRLADATTAERIGHIAKPLYSWRTIEGSTAADIEAKPEAHDAGHRALAESLDRRGVAGRVEDGSVPTVHVTRHHVDPSTLVSVIIPTRDRVDLLEPCVHALKERTDWDNYEIIICDNNTADAATLRYLREFEGPRQRVVRYPHQFNYARQMNLSASEAHGDLLLMLNNDALVHTPEWMTAMAEQATQPDVGVVGARLLFPDGRTQHEGIGLGMAGPAVNLQFAGHRGYDQFVRDVSAVTGAAAMVRAEVFRLVGGFDERLRVAFNDVDLCLRIAELGYRNVYTPLAELAHPESASRGSLHPIPDEDLFHSIWGTKGQLRDPWLNPNFEWFSPLLYRI